MTTEDLDSSFFDCAWKGKAKVSILHQSRTMGTSDIAKSTCISVSDFAKNPIIKLCRRAKSPRRLPTTAHVADFAKAVVLLGLCQQNSISVACRDSLREALITSDWSSRQHTTSVYSTHGLLPFLRVSSATTYHVDILLGKLNCS